jgi:hypothetical protein
VIVKKALRWGYFFLQSSMPTFLTSLLNGGQRSKRGRHRSMKLGKD